MFSANRSFDVNSYAAQQQLQQQQQKKLYKRPRSRVQPPPPAPSTPFVPVPPPERPNQVPRPQDELRASASIPGQSPQQRHQETLSWTQSQLSLQEDQQQLYQRHQEKQQRSNSSQPRQSLPRPWAGIEGASSAQSTPPARRTITHNGGSKSMRKERDLQEQERGNLDRQVSPAQTPEHVPAATKRLKTSHSGQEQGRKRPIAGSMSTERRDTGTEARESINGRQGGRPREIADGPSTKCCHCAAELVSKAYRCQSCPLPTFLCPNCLRNAATVHPGHGFVRVIRRAVASPPPSPEPSPDQTPRRQPPPPESPSVNTGRRTSVTKANADSVVRRSTAAAIPKVPKVPVKKTLPVKSVICTFCRETVSGMQHVCKPCDMRLCAICATLPHQHPMEQLPVPAEVSASTSRGIEASDDADISDIEQPVCDDRDEGVDEDENPVDSTGHGSGDDQDFGDEGVDGDEDVGDGFSEQQYEASIADEEGVGNGISRQGQRLGTDSASDIEFTESTVISDNDAGTGGRSTRRHCRIEPGSDSDIDITQPGAQGPDARSSFKNSRPAVKKRPGRQASAEPESDEVDGGSRSNTRHRSSSRILQTPSRPSNFKGTPQVDLALKRFNEQFELAQNMMNTAQQIMQQATSSFLESGGNLASPGVLRRPGSASRLSDASTAVQEPGRKMSKDKMLQIPHVMPRSKSNSRNSRRPWTDEDLRQFRNLKAREWSLAQIANETGRSMTALTQQWTKMKRAASGTSIL